MPKIETTGVPASTSACTLGSSSTRYRASRVAPNAVRLGVRERQVARAREELLVLRIRPRPSALDVVDAELVELLRDEQLVVDRKRDRFALGAVAQRGVEGVDAHEVSRPEPGPSRDENCTMPGERRLNA